MYLKQLELQGFKSFPERTQIAFGHDITAIVGPNGSGKSNISDAIRWVMGEQNSRLLRGQKMEDVIFGGTAKRSQVGFAEAVLVLDNTDRAIPYESDELSITRRYYRSGESEYYINRQSVRLRDINELFMDTGLGKEGYSNISQGRIDEILALKSADRREIFEEAAGISKYRHRKEETERRLSTTEENLLRIGDKISELELQVEPLREQAEKARKFLTYREELKGIEIALWLQTLEKLSASARKAEEDYRSTAFILQQEKSAWDALDALTETLAEELRERDIRLDDLRGQIAQSETQTQAIQGEIGVLRTNLENCAANLSRVRGELAEQDSRSSGIAAQIRALEARMLEIEEAASNLQETLRQAEEEGRKLADSADGMTKRYLTLRGKEERLKDELAEKNAERSAAEASLAQSAQRQTQVRGDLAAAYSRKTEAEQALAGARTSREQIGEEIDASTNAVAGYRLRGKLQFDKRDALRRQVSEESVAMQTTASRLKLFEEMEREFEGYSKAVRVVMQQAQRGTLRGIHGPVSSLLRTEDAYTVAIEIALGSAMQHIVVDDEQTAKTAIQFLKRSDNGRATFLPLSVIQGRMLSEQGVDTCAGFVGIASELVKSDAGYAQIVRNLLGKTVIAEDLDAAIRIADRFHHRFRIVTLDGQVINAGGAITGGSVSRNTGVLSRANEIERLKRRLKTERETLEQHNGALAEAERLAQQAEYELSAEEERLRTLQDTALRLDGELRQYEALSSAIGEAVAQSEGELRLLEEHAEAESRRRDTLQDEIDAVQRRLAETAQELHTLSDSQSDAAEQGNRLGERMTELRMQSAALEAEKTTAGDSVVRLRELERAMQGDWTQKHTLIDTYETESRALQAQLAERQTALETQSAETQRQRELLQAALEERMQAEAHKTATERQAKDKSRDILKLQGESARLEAKKTTAEMEEKQIIDRLWESYALTPSTAKQAAAEIESVSAAQKRSAELKRKIGALGTPNLGAIDEFARVNERYEYLCGQRDDILTAKHELEQIIRDITGEMTAIFTSEFAKINTYFSQTFTEMFGGGTAALELEDANQPLSSGIEIRVQPPGKQLKTITLLSGGEKAFVAIALYFAILKVRPTPFCMLDEIDAALDDRNVIRFASYLRGLSKNTQFIVITHRRGTMEASDMLYGVTMQEQGISKILQLDLNRMEQQIGEITEDGNGPVRKN